MKLRRVDILPIGNKLSMGAVPSFVNLGFFDKNVKLSCFSRNNYVSAFLVSENFCYTLSPIVNVKGRSEKESGSNVRNFFLKLSYNFHK